MKFVGETNPLPGMFYIVTPDTGIPETVYEVPVQFPADIFNTAACPDYKRFFEIGLFTLWAEEEPHKSQFLVDLLF